MKQGDAVLIWGATGRPRRLRRAVRAQRRRHPGRRRVVARQGRAAARARLSSTSSTARQPATSSGRTSTPRTRRSGAASARTSAASSARTPNIVFEHPGRQTMGASVFVCARGGTIVTCAATSGYMIEYDNRHLWMKLKSIKSVALRQLPRGVGRQPADRRGQDPADPLGRATRSTDVGEAAYQVHHNLHEGKIGVLCLAPEEGLGIDDPEFREQGRRGQDHPVPPARRIGGRRCCSPRSTTSPSPSTTSRPPSPTTARPSAPTVEHREVVESDGVEEALLKVADRYIQLLTPDPRRLAGGQVPREAGRGPAPRRLPGRRLRRGARGGEGRRAAGSSTRSPARAPAARPSPSSTRRALRHPHRAGPGVSDRGPGSRRGPQPGAGGAARALPHLLGRRAVQHLPDARSASEADEASHGAGHRPAGEGQPAAPDPGDRHPARRLAHRVRLRVGPAHPDRPGLRAGPGGNRRPGHRGGRRVLSTVPTGWR